MIHCRKGGAARALPVATLAHKMGRRCFVMLALLAQVREPPLLGTRYGWSLELFTIMSAAPRLLVAAPGSCTCCFAVVGCCCCSRMTFIHNDTNNND